MLGQPPVKPETQIFNLKEAHKQCNMENFIFRAKQRKQIKFDLNYFEGHYKVESVSEITGFEVSRLYLSSIYAHDVWLMISTHFVYCTQENKTSLLVHPPLLETLVSKVCNDFNNLSDLINRLEKPNLYSGKSHIYFDNAISYEARSSFYGFYLSLNVPDRTAYLNISLDFRFNKEFKILFVVPVKDFHLVVPTSTIPKCFIRLKKRPYIKLKSMNYFNLELKGLQQNGQQAVKLEPIGRGLKQTISDEHFHNKLYNFFKCSINNFSFHKCFTQKISWNTANKLCTSRGLDLPAVHSVGDIERIIQQIEKQQCKASIMSVNRDRHAFHILHRTIGIYIGLHFKVLHGFWLIWLCQK